VPHSWNILVALFESEPEFIHRILSQNWRITYSDTFLIETMRVTLMATSLKKIGIQYAYQAYKSIVVERWGSTIWPMMLCTMGTSSIQGCTLILWSSPQKQDCAHNRTGMHLWLGSSMCISCQLIQVWGRKCCTQWTFYGYVGLERSLANITMDSATHTCQK